MHTLQPVLAPCKGTLADLHVQDDPADPERLLIYWGTAILQVVPRNRESFLFRVTACLLLNLKFRIGAVGKALGVTEKTLRSWQRAFNQGSWEQKIEPFHGPGAPRRLRPDVEQYVRTGYRAALNEHNGRLPYAFRDRLCRDVSKIWPDQEVSGEVLRQVFRDEDVKIATHSQADTNCAHICADASPLPGERHEVEAQSIDASGAVETALEHEARSSDATAQSRKVPPDSATPESSGNSTITDDATRVYAGSEAPGPELENREQPCELPQHSDDAERLASDPGCSTSTHTALRPKLGSEYFPVLADNRSQQPFFCPHAGLLLLSSGFDRAFGHLAPILRQTAAQILCGAVNQEQSKFIDSTALGRIIGKVLCDRDRQRTLLDEWIAGHELMEVYRGNLAVLNMSRHEQPGNLVVLYCDTHQEPYTGVEKLLTTWSTNSKRVEKTLAIEYVHSELGGPLFASHFDNFYDARMRFLLMRTTLCSLLEPDVKALWVFDRGYWGIDFLRQLAVPGDGFITWQKGYKNDGWSQPFDVEGEFELIRQGNNAADRRLVVRLAFREQQWQRVSFETGRRLIVRVQRDGPADNEVAIVSNAPTTMSARTIIVRMFDRFGVQENDFSYQGRHFGLNELTARAFDPYAEIADELIDREIDSRAYKAARKQKERLAKELAGELFKLDSMAPISLRQLQKQRDKLCGQRDRLAQQYEDLLNSSESTSAKLLARLRARIAKVEGRFRDLDRKQQQAEKRAVKEEECSRLRTQLEHIVEQLGCLDKTESRLLMLVEEKYVRPNMKRKALVDALRMTSRNVFADTFEVFRATYDNFRDDHQVLRTLTRAPGFIVPRSDRVDVYLFPSLELQPAQWDRVDQFLEQCRARMGKHFGVDVRFLTRISDAQFIRTIWTAQARCRAP